VSVKDKSITIYYDSHEIDIKQLFKVLKEIKGSRYENRSDSEIGLMAVSEWLAEQIKQHAINTNQQDKLL
jgi:hypothetical protein